MNEWNRFVFDQIASHPALNISSTYGRKSGRTLKSQEEHFFHSWYPNQAGGWSDARVLDVGCGAGRVYNHFTSNGIPIRSYHGVDYSEQMVAEAQRWLASLARQFPNAPPHTVVRGDMRRLRTVADKSVDVCLILASSLDYVTHSDRAIALWQAARVLEPGGVLFISTANLAFLLDGTGVVAGSALDRHVRVGQAQKRRVNEKVANFSEGVARRQQWAYAYAHANGQSSPQYSNLVHYIGWELQQSQLATAGFETLAIYSPVFSASTNILRLNRTEQTRLSRMSYHMTFVARKLS